MRKLSTFITVLTLAAPALLWAQAPKKVASTAQIQAKATHRPLVQQQYAQENPNMMAAKPIGRTTPTLSPNGKTAAVSPIALGTASNGFTGLTTYQNQVVSVDSLDVVAYIHRQDINIWGGGGTANGQYRYDISLDGGSTFTNDIGPIQTVYTNYGRYPQISAFNPGTTRNPFDAKLPYYGPTNRFPTPGWLDHVSGLAQLSNASPITSTETYQFDGRNPVLPGGLCQGLPGEFWTVAFQDDGTDITDTMFIFKGTYNSGTQDLNWAIHAAVTPGYDRSFDGSVVGICPNIAFSPDGTHGWISILGNIGTDPKNETVFPIFWHSTDGGATWGPPTEVDLDLVPWMADSLQSLWVDTTGFPASSGFATTAFEADITVDEYGDVHMGVVLGTAAGGFAISSGLAKFMADVHSTGQGTGWDATYIAPVLTFRGEFGTGSQTLTQDNFPQVSRDEAGTMVFYSWADSDTSLLSGNQNGVGFGTADNLAPNLRIGVRRVIDGAMSYPKLITDGDLLWEGRALVPTMAPTVHKIGSRYELPIVMVDMVNNDVSLACAFWYFGNDAFYDFSVDSWCNGPDMDLGWSTWGYSGATPPCAVGIDNQVDNGIVLNQSFPNPTSQDAVIRFNLPSSMNIRMDLVNMYGQTVASLANGEYQAGNHDVLVETSELAAGVYFYNLYAEGQVLSKKMIVTK